MHNVNLLCDLYFVPLQNANQVGGLPTHLSLVDTVGAVRMEDVQTNVKIMENAVSYEVIIFLHNVISLV